MHAATSPSPTRRPGRTRGFRMLTAAVTASTFAGLSGVVAPVAIAQFNIVGRIKQEYFEASSKPIRMPLSARTPGAPSSWTAGLTRSF